MADPDSLFADLLPDSGARFGPPPKPKEKKAPVFVPQGATQMFDPETNTYVPVPQPTKEEKDALKGAIEGLSLEELLTGVKRARSNLGTGWATGTWGAIAELKPGGGTPRDDFLGNLKSIQGGIINEKLQALKEASKTGASGMGALSEKEGERLASSVASLTDDMSQQGYEDSFKEIARHAYTLQAVRDGKDPRSADTQADIDKQIQTFFAAQTEPSGGGGDTPPGATELTPDQQRAYAAFIKANPNPTGPQVKTFLEELTGVPGGQVTNAEDIAAGIRAGKGVSGQLRRSDIEAEAHQKAEEMRRESEQGLGGARGAATVGGFGDSAGVGFLDEAGAGVGALTDSLQGKGSIGDRYDVNLAANREYMGALQADHPGYYGGGQFAGALVLPTGKISGALDAAKVGAGYGALYGFGSGTDTGDRLSRAAVGGAVGGAGGAAVSALAPFVASRLPRRLGGPSRGMAPDVAEAAANENVDLIRPMVDPNAVSEYGALESNVYSQPIIRGAAGRVRGQIEDRVSQLAPTGAALETGAAGDVIQTAGNRFIQRSRNIKNRLYDRAEKLGGDTTVETKEAQGQIDTELTQLGEAPQTNAGEIKFLEGLKSDLSQPQTVGSIRRIRSSLRGQINAANLTNTSAEARALKVLDAARNDIQRDAPADAAAAYSRADAFNRERQTHIDTVLKQFLGRRDAPLDSEKAFARLKALASPGGGGRNLAAMMRNLEPDERQDIAATIAHALGRRGEDEPFSTALFLSQTRKLSPSARRTIFGPDGAQSIDNLRLLSQRLEAGEKDINFSRSATVLERQGWRMAARNVITTLAGLGGAGAMGAGHYGTGVAGLAVAGTAMGASATRKVLSARAMVNPRVSRWLAEAADVSSPEQAAQSVRKLGVIIAREPALAQELKPVQDFLTQRITQPLAAEEQGNKDE